MSAARLVMVLTRLIAMLVALQMSSALHDVGDVLSAITGESSAHDCDYSNETQECPAGCPNCHCSAQNNIVVPRITDSVALLDVPCDELPTLVLFESVPQAPFLSGLFRPPRQSPVS